MRESRRAVLSAVALLVCTGVAGFAQIVISTQAGLINFTQDAVLLNGRQIEPKPGLYRLETDSAVLRVLDGKAAVSSGGRVAP
ncbi:MAG: hypothetical protein IT159_03265 [Bryobacterales bacterium]|nr:hypothetical protein [Bryobacterales bacterium]